MTQADRTKEYEKIIKKIKRNRKIVTAVFIIIALILLAFSCPLQLEVASTVIANYEGLPFIAILFIYLLLTFCYMVAYACASLPLTTSMDNECDPQKHLTLNVILNKQQNLDSIYSSDYLWLGNFSGSLEYSSKLISSEKIQFVIVGLFNKARAEFFIGNTEALCRTAEDFKAALSTASQKLNKKNMEVISIEQKCLEMLVAIACDDRAVIADYKNLKPWRNSKATQCYIDYIKGVAAYTLEEKQEAIHLFMTVKENCDKTILARFSETYLERMK